MEQAPPDPERQLQPAPVEPLGGPGALLEAAVGEEETEGTREDSSGVDTMTGNHFWLKKIEISVSEAEKRTGRNAMNMQETYTAYLIETRSVEHADGQSVLTDSLWRRYSEFELLRNYLLVYYPHVVVPPLPEKRAEFVWHKLSADNMDPDFVERRRIGLENFLLRVASHPVLCRDKIFYLFLTQEGNWKETVNETGFQLKADSRLKALNATFRVKNPDKRFTELKHYSDELQSVISHLLRVRARVADRLYVTSLALFNFSSNSCLGFTKILRNPSHSLRILIVRSSVIVTVHMENLSRLIFDDSQYPSRFIMYIILKIFLF
uniref:PX domain-containing protein n=1 Tax=Peromyscus maniculatus bairdii TaxID=230844 RepID=A0A8C8W6L5_PERMB